ncbi:hypothetical protein Nepgr_001479 [Nepenthes gracilis]|uniref:Uncharacterized protein n=1 Tax=Nepenthes gracilis TaxID=150966 RepID=A0AAD3P2R2_NEPGR|nr:hypothetical protein Nepgr_001479 [Nepenthes gracilis]
MDDQNMRLAGYIQECIRCLPSLSTGYSIYQVPENLRSMNEAAYRPLVVSIGPFYCKDERLRPMEEYKLRYLSTFMNHLLNIERLKDYIEIIRGKEEEIRQHYLQKFELYSDEFTKMVMLDSVFIIELFRRLNDSTLREENDPLFYKPRMIDDVYAILQLLENQLPIFIIEFLYNSAFPVSPVNSTQRK